jgi:hypothetical protein
LNEFVRIFNQKAFLGNNISLTQELNQDKPKFKSEIFTADNDDIAYGCIPGKKYKIVIAQEDGTSKSGKPFFKGEWFIIDVKKNN